MSSRESKTRHGSAVRSDRDGPSGLTLCCSPAPSAGCFYAMDSLGLHSHESVHPDVDFTSIKMRPRDEEKQEFSLDIT